MQVCEGKIKAARTAHMPLHLAQESSRQTRAARGKPLLNALMPSKTANKLLGSRMNRAINNTKLPVWHHSAALAELRREGFIYCRANAIWSASASAFVLDGNDVGEAGGTSVALLSPDLRGHGPASLCLKVTKHPRACGTKLRHPLGSMQCCPDAHGENPPVKQSSGCSRLSQSYCGALFDGS